MKVLVQVEVEAPKGATHYFGNLLDGPIWIYCSQVGVVGDHWWQYDEESEEWRFLSHHKLHGLKEILGVNIATIE